MREGENEKDWEEGGGFTRLNRVLRIGLRK